MTELEQKLLDELENLEKSREKELYEYKKQLLLISKEISNEYQKSWNTTLEKENNSNKNLIMHLKMLIEQNNQIITLLKRASETNKQESKEEEIIEQLLPTLEKFFTTLETNLTDSNKALIEQIQSSIKR